jgi:hypothetical protein
VNSPTKQDCSFSHQPKCSTRSGKEDLGPRTALNLETQKMEVLISLMELSAAEMIVESIRDDFSLTDLPILMVRISIKT